MHEVLWFQRYTVLSQRFVVYFYPPGILREDVAKEDAFLRKKKQCVFLQAKAEFIVVVVFCPVQVL